MAFHPSPRFDRSRVLCFPRQRPAASIPPGRCLSVRYPDCGSDLAKVTGSFAPGSARVLADVNFAEQRERHDAVGIGGMRGTPPDGRIGWSGQLEDLPALPVISGA